MPGTRGEFHVKTAWVAGVPLIAVKVASGFYDNPALGLPTGSGLMALFDAATGMPLGLLFDNGFLTDIRTGAAGAVAADCLARRGRRNRRGGRVRASRRASRWRACARSGASGGSSPGASTGRGWTPYCRELRDDVRPRGRGGRAARKRSAGRRTCSSRRRRRPRRWSAPTGCVPACTSRRVGSDTPGKQELDAACLGRADRVVVDRLAQCARFGELSHALAAGLMREADVWAQLGERSSPAVRPGRTGDDADHDLRSDRRRVPGHGDRGVRLGRAVRENGLAVEARPVEQGRCMIDGTGTGIRTPVPWLRTTCPNP